MLNAIPDQDSFYDVSDALEEQGLEKIVQYHMHRKGAERDLLDQFLLYEAVLHHEDGVEDTQLIGSVENIRYHPLFWGSQYW